MRVPKTGSTTLFHAINSQTNSRYYIHPGHLYANTLPDNINKTYNIYAFYRDPYARFISCWQRLISNIERDFLKWHDLLVVKRLVNNDNRIKKEMIRNISVEDVISCINYPMLQGIFSFQKNFYLPDTMLFDYSNYETNVRTLLNLIGLDSTVELKRLSVSNSQHLYDSITADEKKLIREYYKPDYEYFASRNIYFDS
jgi:hypothetical protein